MRGASEDVDEGLAGSSEGFDVEAFVIRKELEGPWRNNPMWTTKRVILLILSSLYIAHITWSYRVRVWADVGVFRLVILIYRVYVEAVQGLSGWCSSVSMGCQPVSINVFAKP